MQHYDLSISDFINVLKVIDSFQTLVTEISLPDDRGGRKKWPVFYEIRINDNDVILTGYPISPVKDDEYNFKINTESDFFNKRTFWAGDPKVVFTDYNGLTDKKIGSLVWCATTYRSSVYSNFYINLHKPLISLNIPLKLIDIINTDTNLFRKENDTISLTTTIPDTVLDTAPQFTPTNFIDSKLIAE